MKSVRYISAGCAVLLLGMVLSSCTGYLNVQPQGKVLPKTDEEFASIMHNLINDIEGGYDTYVVGNMESIAQFEGFADNLDANLKTGNLPSYAGEKINARQTDYRSIYQHIKDCNIIIGHLEGRTGEVAVGTLAAAFALKGICYYNLVRDWCEPWEAGQERKQLGVPVVEEFDIFAMPVRSDLKTTVDYCASLLQKSIGYHMTDDKYFFTETVTKAYLAKLMFWSEDWEKTISICEDLYRNSGVELTGIDGYTGMIQSEKDLKGEMIVRSHINDASELDWYFSALKGYIRARPVSASFVKLFDQDKEKDIRYANSFDSMRMNKKNPEAKVRMSEIVLMLAEAHCHLGHADEALEWLNLLRRNRITGCQDLTEATLPAVRAGERIREDAEGQPLTPLMQAIFDERRKELYMEGDRWFELKRNGRPEWWIINNGLKYTTRKYLYTAPIYKGDVDMNEGMIQNEGYIY